MNEWSEWQLDNLNAIVWLHQGEVEKYKDLLNDYYYTILKLLATLITSFREISESNESVYDDYNKKVDILVEEVHCMTKLDESFSIESVLNDVRVELKKTFEKMIDDKSLLERIVIHSNVKKRGFKNTKEYKKWVTNRLEEILKPVDEVITIINEAKWLYDKFGEGEYRDILGLCKRASRAEIAEKGYSLTPGAYVGVAPVEDDGVDFAQRMKEIHSELLSLQAESNSLMKTISKNMEELGV